MPKSCPVVTLLLTALLTGCAPVAAPTVAPIDVRATLVAVPTATLPVPPATSRPPVTIGAPATATAAPAKSAFASAAPAVWDTTASPDQLTGDCPDGSIVPPYGPVLLTPAAGALQWKDVQNAVYLFAPAGGEVFTYTGPNGRKDGVITMSLTFQDAQHFAMRADYVKDGAPGCVHGYIYAGVFKFAR